MDSSHSVLALSLVVAARTEQYVCFESKVVIEANLNNKTRRCGEFAFKRRPELDSLVGKQ